MRFIQYTHSTCCHTKLKAKKIIQLIYLASARTFPHRHDCLFVFHLLLPTPFAILLFCFHFCLVDRFVFVLWHADFVAPLSYLNFTTATYNKQRPTVSKQARQIFVKQQQSCQTLARTHTHTYICKFNAQVQNVSNIGMSF